MLSQVPNGVRPIGNKESDHGSAEGTYAEDSEDEDDDSGEDNKAESSLSPEIRSERCTKQSQARLWVRARWQHRVPEPRSALGRRRPNRWRSLQSSSR